MTGSYSEENVYIEELGCFFLKLPGAKQKGLWEDEKGEASVYLKVFTENLSLEASDLWSDQIHRQKQIPVTFLDRSHRIVFGYPTLTLNEVAKLPDDLRWGAETPA